jgi:hypothetical protein
MSSPSRISQLSELIAENTATINSFFVENNLPTPSFEANALWSLPIPEDATNIKTARLAIISACAELQALVTGPKDYLTVNVRDDMCSLWGGNSLELVYCPYKHSHNLTLQPGQVVSCGRINHL